ncbi:DinB family protein [Piscinibacter sp.]|uniref:DinB family protein n=1 Tax=Piscinibacter sp. TaxID=1903157 RepID=UPI0039E2FD39
MTPQAASLMAEYNRWMNERMYDAAATLDAATLAADKGAFFGSILGTLNHIATADTIWLHRFARFEPSFDSLGALSRFPQPSSLTQRLAPDLAGLRSYRRELDALITRWVAELQPEHLSSDLSYGNMAGVQSRRRLDALLQHFFNHQTHHRGQASTLLFQSGVDIGVTDLLAVIPRSDA